MPCRAGDNCKHKVNVIPPCASSRLASRTPTDVSPHASLFVFLSSSYPLFRRLRARLMRVPSIGLCGHLLPLSDWLHWVLLIDDIDNKILRHNDSNGRCRPSRTTTLFSLKVRLPCSRAECLLHVVYAATSSLPTFLSLSSSRFTCSPLCSHSTPGCSRNDKKLRHIGNEQRHWDKGKTLPYFFRETGMTFSSCSPRCSPPPPLPSPRRPLSSPGRHHRPPPPRCPRRRPPHSRRPPLVLVLLLVVVVPTTKSNERRAARRQDERTEDEARKTRSGSDGTTGREIASRSRRCLFPCC